MSVGYLHPDDYPWTNVLLSVVISGGRGLARDVPGYTVEPEGGASVDWDVLLGSFLSSTEKAAVHIARGISIAERQGGFPPGIGPVALAAMQSIVEGEVEAAAAVEAFLALPEDEREEVRRRMRQAARDGR